MCPDTPQTFGSELIQAAGFQPVIRAYPWGPWRLLGKRWNTEEALPCVSSPAAGKPGGREGTTCRWFAVLECRGEPCGGGEGEHGKQGFAVASRAPRVPLSAGPGGRSLGGAVPAALNPPPSSLPHKHQASAFHPSLQAGFSQGPLGHTFPHPVVALSKYYHF